jgi:Na+/proline symporter
MAVARHSNEAAALAFSSASFTSWNTEMQGIRQRAVDLVKDVSGDRAYNDVNFVFPTWVTTQLPIGVVGIVIAAIFAAAMSAVSAELAALSTATVIDFYRRWIRPQAEDRHFLIVSRFATAFWGLFASVVAIFSVELGSLIEVVNRFGSFFYGSILGVFALAILVRRASGTAAFVGLMAGMVAVAAVALGRPEISFLWHNVVGASVVLVVGWGLSLVAPVAPAATRGAPS